MKTLVESIFDVDELENNNTLTLKGFDVDMKLWKECKKSFEWFRKKIVQGGAVEYEELGLRDPIHTVIYNEDDCVMWVPRFKKDVLTIISPETIWYNYVNDALGYIQTHGDEVDYAHRRTGICSMTFAKRKGGDFYKLEYVDANGYVPETISEKAKKIIEKY